VQGDLKIFTDTATLLNIAYPAAWSETHCQRTTLSDGSQSLVIGNLLRLKVAPRRGLTVRQWADA
jgi:hypothetical protein